MSHNPARNQIAPRSGRFADPADGSGSVGDAPRDGGANTDAAVALAGGVAGISVSDGSESAHHQTHARTTTDNRLLNVIASQNAEAPAAAFLVLTENGPTVAYLVDVAALEHTASLQPLLDTVAGGIAVSSGVKVGGVSSWPLTMALGGGGDSINAANNDDPNVVGPPPNAAPGGSGLISALLPPVMNSTSLETTQDELVTLETALPASPPAGKGPPAGQGLAGEAAEENRRNDLEVEQQIIEEGSRRKTPKVMGGDPDPSHPPRFGIGERRRTQNRIAQRTFRERQKKKIADANAMIMDLNERIHRLEVDNAVLMKENEMLKDMMKQYGYKPPEDPLD